MHLDAIPYGSRLSSRVAHLSVEEITAEDGCKVLVQCIEEAHDYLKVAKLEQAVNAAIFGGRTRVGQTLLIRVSNNKASSICRAEEAGLGSAVNRCWAAFLRPACDETGRAFFGRGAAHPSLDRLLHRLSEGGGAGYQESLWRRC